MNSRWTSKNPHEFKPGDIICNAEKQDFKRLVIKVDEEAIWCVGLVHAAFTEANDTHPVFPIRFDEIDENPGDGHWEKLVRLGNLTDYMEYVERVQDECTYEPKEQKGE